MVEDVWCEANILRVSNPDQTVRNLRPMKESVDGEIGVVVPMEQVVAEGQVEGAAQETVPRDCPVPTDVLEWVRESQQRV